MEEFETLVSDLERDSSIASIFGVLIYTDSHPNIKKTMRDQDYWEAFDEITGEKFVVLSVKPVLGKYSYLPPPPGVLCQMVAIWKEPKDNLRLIEALEIGTTEKLPMLLIFTRVGEEVLKIEIDLKEDSPSSAYSSIRESLEFCSNVISGIAAENLKNPKGLYASFALQNDHRMRVNSIKNCLNLYQFVKRLLL
ncbi:hypothetical protein [Vibrio diabolicus]|uniref:hypothetical protein n=1 Tax=Vibrio diabolicus TaxID=50719 RepID=UPI00215E2102|nr:hypothetical protein [Vibrio diabolicus]MCS0445087.1 hypothetical protein [Vibrio diabolicus]